MSVAVKAGDNLYIGGVTSIDDETGKVIGAGEPVKQLEVIYQRLSKILQAYGASAKDMVSETLYMKVKNEEQLLGAVNVRAKFYKGVAPPTIAGITPAAFAGDEILMELTGVAYLGK
jgi:enamine deaminase RidA (YjgF/YER057c/UK114 family)